MTMTDALGTDRRDRPSACSASCSESPFLFGVATTRTQGCDDCLLLAQLLIGCAGDFAGASSPLFCQNASYLAFLNSLAVLLGSPDTDLREGERFAGFAASFIYV